MRLIATHPSLIEVLSAVAFSSGKPFIYQTIESNHPTVSQQPPLTSFPVKLPARRWLGAAAPLDGL